MRCGQIDFPDELLHAIRDGRFVVFAGAGVSMGAPANLPSFWSLAEQVAAGSGLAPHEPLDHFLGQLHHQGIAVHQLAASSLSRPDLAATTLHSDLLRLFPLPEQVRVVTTNFDLLFQHAAEGIWGAVPEVCRAPALPLGRNFHGIVHVHGALTAHQDIVLTDSDFGRAYLTEGWARRFLVDVFRHFTVLFVGYSHSDTVMRYLARALPEQEAGRRYALDSTEGNPQFWRLLGIQPILFPKSHKSDYSELYDGVRQLAKHVRRGILDWQREITALAESGPPMDEASVGLIAQGLKEVATTRFFVKAARAQEWIEWLEKRGVFDALFDGTTLSEQSNLLARWLAEHYALQYPSAIFLLIGRHSLRLNTIFWWILAREVSLGESPIDTNIYARWVSLLLATAPQDADADPLNWLAERGAKLGDFRSVLQIFAHMAAWYLEVKLSFPWASDELAEQAARVDMHTPIRAEHWHLQEVWQKYLRPHLASLAAPILSIIVAHLQQKYAIHSLWQTANREWDGDSYRRSAIEPHEQDKYPQALDVLIDAARDAVEWLAHNDASLFSAWCEQLIRAEAPLLRRLAIHGMAEYAAISWDDKLRWLFVKAELHTSALHHEIFRLVRCAYPYAHVATREQLIERILAWQWPDQDDPEKERHTASTHYDWFLWLHDADPACQLAIVPLDALRQQYPQWQPREYPDLRHWHSDAQEVHPERPWSSEQLLAKPAKDWLDDLLEFRGTGFPWPSRSGLLHAISDAAKQRFGWGCELAEALAARSDWHSDLWEALIRVVSLNSRDGFVLF